MKRFLFTAVAALSALTLFTVPATASEDWKLVRKKNGISTYETAVDGSTYKAFKCVTTVNASMAAIGAVLRDVTEYPKWMDKVSGTDIIKKHNANDMDVYIVMNFPWPTKDRDAVASARTTIDPSTGDVTITTELFENKDFPPNDKFVRLPKMFQQFILKYKEFDKTEVTYSLHMETGGSLKAILVDSHTQKSPHKSLENMKTFVQNEKYANADPLDAENIATARAIITAIAKKAYKDRDIINMLTTDKELMKISIKAGFSEDGVMKIANALMKKYIKTDMFTDKIRGHEKEDLLALTASSDAVAEKLTNDAVLLKTLLNQGEVNNQVLDIIADRVK